MFVLDLCDNISNFEPIATHRRDEILNSGQNKELFTSCISKRRLSECMSEFSKV